MDNLLEYKKPALTIEQQIQFLSSQGLYIEDTDVAYKMLSTIGYYRLSGYLLPFKDPHQDNGPRQFRIGTTFEQIRRLYEFDQELRFLVTEAIEKIEVAFRAAIANATSVAFNPFWYVDRSYHKDTKPYDLVMRNVAKITKDRHEVFIRHYYEKYRNPEFPPIWMMTETFSFGVCSKLFQNIKKKAVRQQISQGFNQHTTIIESWIQTLAYVRNICAHHGRLWNRWLVNAPLTIKDDELNEKIFSNNRKFIAVSFVLIKLLKEIASTTTWQKKLYKLFERYSAIPGETMGFTKHWQEDPIWKL